MIETLAHGYSSEGTLWELSNEYQYDRVSRLLTLVLLLAIPGFQSFAGFFSSFCIGQISHKQHTGYNRVVLFVNLTLMLLVANLANTKWCKNMDNDQNPGKWVLIWKCSVRAIQWIPTLQGLDAFKKYLCPCAFDKSRLSIRRVNTTMPVAARKAWQLVDIFKTDLCVLWRIIQGEVI